MVPPPYSQYWLVYISFLQYLEIVPHIDYKVSEQLIYCHPTKIIIRQVCIFWCYYPHKQQGVAIFSSHIEISHGLIRENFSICPKRGGNVFKILTEQTPLILGVVPNGLLHGSYFNCESIQSSLDKCYVNDHCCCYNRLQ